MGHLAQHQPVRWALPAVIALVASLLMVVATPAQAEPGIAEGSLGYDSACTAPTIEANDFTDVSDGHTHRSAIDCLVHYGITVGTGDGTTFDPEGTVTRSQMALFMQRAADVVGVNLGGALVQGFTDIGGLATYVQHTINRVAHAGIVTGTSPTRFGPGDEVTRGEMAKILVAFLNKASSRVSVHEQTGVVTVTLANGSTRRESDEVFADSRFTAPVVVDRAVSALAELGVARGTTTTTFTPDRPVTRAQMAAFITRALAFTEARPVGISISPAFLLHNATTYTIHVRDENFNPIRNARIDVFYVRGDSSRAFTSSGRCNTNVSTGGVRSAQSGACRIDAIDQLTNRNGQLSVTVPYRTDSTTPITVWAWSGQIGEQFQTSRLHSTFVSAAAPPPPSVATGTEYLVTAVPDTGYARLGARATVTLQVVDRTGPVAEPGRVFRGHIETRLGSDTGVVLVSRPFELITDSSGAATFTVGGSSEYMVDRPFDEPDQVVSWTLEEVPNIFDIDPTTITGRYGGANNYGAIRADRDNVTSLVFSDDAPVAASISARPDERYAWSSGSNAANSVVVSVTDQYGQGLFNYPVRLIATLSEVPRSALYTSTDGTVRIGIGQKLAGSWREQIVVEGIAEDNLRTEFSVIWAELPDSSYTSTTHSRNVVAADEFRSEIVVTDLNRYYVLFYDATDRFYLSDITSSPPRGLSEVSLPVFNEALTSAVAEDSGKVARLSWRNLNPSGDTVTTWTLRVT